jgi:hypothetical protein
MLYPLPGKHVCGQNNPGSVKKVNIEELKTTIEKDEDSSWQFEVDIRNADSLLWNYYFLL